MAVLKLAVSLIVMVLMDITVLSDVLTQLRVPDSQCIKGESYPHISYHLYPRTTSYTSTPMDLFAPLFTKSDSEPKFEPANPVDSDSNSSGGCIVA